MMFFKSALTLSVLLVVVSAFSRERGAPAHKQVSVKMATDAPVGKVQGTQAPTSSLVQQPMQLHISDHRTVPSFKVLESDCEKEDEDDCTEFCSLLEQTSTCRASGNKVTCFCKGGKSESNCEERCLLCMPDKSALEEATRFFEDEDL